MISRRNILLHTLHLLTTARQLMINATVDDDMGISRDEYSTVIVQLRQWSKGLEERIRELESEDSE